MAEKEDMLEKSIEEIAAVLAKTDDDRLIHDFLKAILTNQEYGEVAARWALVRLLDSGMTQRKIAETLKLSLCKITRGSREYKKEGSPFRKMIETFKNL